MKSNMVSDIVGGQRRGKRFSNNKAHQLAVAAAFAIKGNGPKKVKGGK